MLILICKCKVPGTKAHSSKRKLSCDIKSILCHTGYRHKFKHWVHVETSASVMAMLSENSKYTRIIQG